MIKAGRVWEAKAVGGGDAEDLAEWRQPAKGRERIKSRFSGKLGVIIWCKTERNLRDPECLGSESNPAQTLQGKDVYCLPDTAQRFVGSTCGLLAEN